MVDLVPIPDEFDDSNDFWPHPIYDNWEANRLGIVRNVVNKKDIGNLEKSGYIRIAVYTYENEKNYVKKHYLKHRFIYECFHGLITNPKLVIDHKNNIKTDNQLQNLQLITQSQNQKKQNKKGLNRPPIKVRAININTNETSDYNSINECSKILDITHASIGRVLNGITKSAISKLDKNKYTFEKLNCETDTNSIKVRAININTGESSDYNSMAECGRILDINNASISCVVKGIQKTAKSKKDKCKYTFEKI